MRSEFSEETNTNRQPNEFVKDLDQTVANVLLGYSTGNENQTSNNEEETNALRPKRTAKKVQQVDMNEVLNYFKSFFFIPHSPPLFALISRLPFQLQLCDADMTDSSSQSDDTSGCGGIASGRSSRGRNSTNSRRRKGTLNAKERNLRRLESNERERMRMHSLNDAFQVITINRKCNYTLKREIHSKENRANVAINSKVINDVT